MHTCVMFFGIMVAIAGAWFGVGSVAGTLAFYTEDGTLVPLGLMLAFSIGSLIGGAWLASFGYAGARPFSQRLVKSAAFGSWALAAIWIGLGLNGMLEQLNWWGASFFEELGTPVAGWMFCAIGVFGLIAILGPFGKEPEVVS